jgi:hypothetical protein
VEEEKGIQGRKETTWKKYEYNIKATLGRNGMWRGLDV